MKCNHPNHSHQHLHHEREHNHHRTYHPGNAYMPHHQQMYRQIMIEDAIRISREQVPGQVVKAELESKNGRLIYEVEVVTAQGVKYEVKVDGNTGAVLEIELD